MECPSCSSKDIEFIESSGHAVCVQCGTVLEENSIVSSVEFQESGDRSHVVGQFVSASSSKSYGSSSRGHSRYGFSRESRDATLSNAKRVISQVFIYDTYHSMLSCGALKVSSSMRLPPYYTDHAHRLYSLALDNKFVYGRRQMHVVATVLYIICRQEKSPHLLIDFSDALQVNVYTIGKTFLQLSRILNLKMPVVDPCLYIHRFVTRLDLGEKMGSISTTALRIVTRMKKDWINTGRRPDGICAAAILIACRSFGVLKSIADIASLFRIAEVTVKKRLQEFKHTPSSQLTVDQFHQHDFNFELDPPTFIRARQEEAGREHRILTYDIPGVGGAEDDESGDVTDDVMFDSSNGHHKQTLRIGDVEIQAELPDPLESGGKNAPTSLKASEKDLRRRELYGKIYSEIGEVFEQQLGDHGQPVRLSTAHLQEQAEVLFEEARKIGQGEGGVGGWGSKSSKMTNEKIFVPSLHKAEDDGAEQDDQEGAHDSEAESGVEMSESELESFILTAEEQAKRAALWEKMHRPFLDEQERKRKARASSSKQSKERGPAKKLKSRKDGVLSLGDGVERNVRHAVSSQQTSAQNEPSSRRGSSNINYDVLSAPQPAAGAVDRAREGTRSQGRKIVVGAAVGGKPTRQVSFRPNAIPSKASDSSEPDGNDRREDDTSTKIELDESNADKKPADEELHLYDDEEEDDDDMLVYEDHRGHDYDDDVDDFDYD